MVTRIRPQADKAERQAVARAVAAAGPPQVVVRAMTVQVVGAVQVELGAMAGAAIQGRVRRGLVAVLRAA
jgi:hypothetical protein